MSDFAQALLTGTTGTAGASLILSGSKVVTAGNSLIVCCGYDIISVNTCTDNLGNTYSHIFNTDYPLHNLRLAVFQANTITGGTLTTQTITSTNTFGRAGFSFE